MAFTLDQPDQAPPSDPAIGAAVGLRPVLALGLVAEAVIAAGLLWPLRIWRPPDRITTSEPLSELIGQSASGLLRFISVLALWSAVYLAALAISRRPVTPAARLALFLMPMLFAVTLVPTWPAASKDAYHYVLEGRLIVAHDANPLTTAPNAFPDDPLFWILSSWESEPSRYGPLWAALTALPAWLGGESLRAAVIGFKAIGVLAFVGTCLFVFLAARHFAPGSALAAYVLVAWNPLFVFESAANAHNDAVMLLFTAGAIYLAMRRNWALTFPALAAAVLIKFTMGLLGPLLLVWAWRSARRQPAERRGLALGLGLSLLLVIVAYAPFWEGPGTFRAITSATVNALNSPGWLLREAMERTFASEGLSRAIVSPLLALLFVLAYGTILYVVATGVVAGPPWLGAFGIVAAYLLTVSWWFWPWYVTWLLPLAAMYAFGGVATITTVWSLAALTAYVPITFRPYFWGEPPDDRMPLAVALTTFIPALAAIAIVTRHFYRTVAAVGARRPA